MKRTGLRLAMALLLAAAAGGCRDAQEGRPTLSEDSALDVAASDANLIDDPGTTSPVGLYQHSGVAGTDGICVSGKPGELRFGLVMHFGATLFCEGRGTAEHDGARLRLTFAGTDCAVDAVYDGRAIRIPGRVPEGCAKLCGPRASISGGAMERTGWAARDALRLRSRRGGSSAGALCTG